MPPPAELPPGFRLSDFLPFRANRVADALGREVVGVYRSMYGLGRPEWRVLAHLGACGPNTARDLVALTAMDKVKVSRAVAALETRGWLDRAVDETDRRINRLRLTAEGETAFRRLMPEMLAAQDRVLSALTAAQRDRLAAALCDLERALGVGCSLNAAETARALEEAAERP